MCVCDGEGGGGGGLFVFFLEPLILFSAAIKPENFIPQPESQNIFFKQARTIFFSLRPTNS